MAAPRGNQNAAKAKVWTSAIERVLDSRTKTRIDKKRELDELAEKLVDLAKAGDLAALKEVGDRLEGKAAQSLEVNANVTRRIAELPDSDLAHILTAPETSGEGAADEASSTPVAPGVH